MNKTIKRIISPLLLALSLSSICHAQPSGTAGPYQLTKAKWQAVLTGTKTASYLVDGSGVCRALLTSDIPSLLATYAAASHTHAASDITSGQVSLARGGTNADLSASGSSTAILAQDASHVISARALVAADIPAALTESQLDFTGIGTFSSAKSQIYSDANAGNLIVTVPSAKSVQTYVNNVLVLGSGYVSGAAGAARWGIGPYANASATTLAGIISTAATNMDQNVATGGYISLNVVNNSLLIAGRGLGAQGDTRWGVGEFGFSGTSTKAGIGYGGTYAQANVPTGQLWQISVAGTNDGLTVGYSNGSQGDTKFALGGFGIAAYSATKAGLAWDTTALRSNVPTGTFEQHKVAGSDLFLLGHANNVQGDTRFALGGYGVGAYDGTKAGIASSSTTSMVHNVATNGAHYFSVNDVVQATIGRAFNSAGSGTFALGLYGSGVTDATKAGIASDSASNLYLNVASGGNHQIRVADTVNSIFGSALTVAGTGNFAVGQYGYGAGDSAKAGVASSASTNLYLNVATGGTITQRVNDVTKLSIGTNVEIGTAALATGATSGFLCLPTCAGTPSGTPSPTTGLAPIIIDTTAGKLWSYYGGAWHWVAFN